MKLAIVHYHLNRGGVTRVIENQLLALDRVVSDGEGHEALIVFGGRSEGWCEDLADRLQRIRLRLYPMPEVDYDSEQPGSKGRLDQVLLDTLCEAGFSPDETIVHFHNHSIGKNAALAKAVWRLAERGFGLLLQIHDFAEDQRPGNFRLLAEAGAGQPDWRGRLYPRAANVHYAVLNGRDRGVLASAGFDPERLHFLPNPVVPRPSLPDRDAAQRKFAERFSVPSDMRLLVYPVRGIRRKNVGEALLHGVLAPRGTVASITLPPLNPAERIYYDRWKAVAARRRLPFRFDTGAPGGLDFAENLAAADAILTTSVAEGFGMVFLEAWLAGCPLTGRDLPEITEDFTTAGLDLSGLRPRLEVPADWIDRRRLRETMCSAYQVVLAAYGRVPDTELAGAFDAKLAGETIDFGDLDENFQEQVIELAVTNSSAREELAAANPWIESAASKSADDIVAGNAGVVRREFSLEPSGARLASVYREVLESSRGGPVAPFSAPEAILDRFLAVKRFRLLRS